MTVDFIRNFPLFSIVLSLFSSVLCLLLPGKKARTYTVCFEILLLIMAGAVLWYTWQGGASFTYVMGEFPAPWGNEIRAGVLEALFAAVFLGIMLCSVLAGWHFLVLDLDESKINLYFTLINLMTAALMSILWTNDIFTGYVFLEILTLTSCGILIVREVGRTTLAAVRYMLLNLLGSGLFLLGVVLLYDTTGHLLMLPMHEAIQALAPDPSSHMVLTFSVAILTIGLAIKSGLFPFHFWMPDTYGWATPTSASILSSLTSKAYILLLIKIYFRVVGPEVLQTMPIGKILLVLGVLGMLFGSVSALRVNNIDRMIAFSSAAQIGYIYMGIGIGGTAGFTAALFHIISHALTKSLLFLTAPRLSEVSGDSLKFRMLQGSARRDRVAGTFFTAAAFSMIGIPVFAGFSSKLMFAVAAVDSASVRKLAIVMGALAVSTLLNAMYFIRTLVRIYSVSESGKDRKLVHYGDCPDYWIPGVVLVAGNLFLGLFSSVVVRLIHVGLGMFS